jgi:hypothetical protein
MLRTFALRWSSFLLAGILVCLPQAAGAQASIFMLLPTDDRVLEVGGEHAGALSASDYTGITGEYVEAWALEGRVGASVTLVLEANGFDGELMVAGPGLPELLRTSDYGSQPCVDFTFLDVGTFHVVVTNREPRGTGLYTLRVVESPDGSGDGCAALRDSDLLGLPTEGRELSTGSLETGSLGADDPMVRDEYAEAWSLNGEAGETLTITMESNEFDPYLYLVSATGVLDSDDDGAGSQNSRITATLSGDGPFAVVATAYSGSGEYTLRVDTGSVTFDSFDSSDSDLLDLPTEGRELSAGSAETSRLGSDDPMVDGEYAEAWSLIGQAGDRVSITMASENFDTFLYLADANGIIDEDDDGGTGTDSQLDATLTGGGPFTVVASAFSGSGEYTIAFSPGLSGVEASLVDAVESEDAARVGRLLAGGADPNVTFVYEGVGGVTALMVAAGEGYPDIVSTLLEHGADPSLTFSAEGMSGLTALFIAAADGRLEITRALLEYGADVNVTVREGTDELTMLAAAAVEGETEIVTVLLENGADPNRTVQYEGREGTVLTLAADEGHTDIVNVLLEYGAEDLRRPR